MHSSKQRARQCMQAQNATSNALLAVCSDANLLLHKVVDHVIEFSGVIMKIQGMSRVWLDVRLKRLRSK
jgi:hypothetical protein